MKRLMRVLLVSCLVLPAAAWSQAQQTALPSSAIPLFAQPLPLLTAAGGSIQTVAGNQPLTVRLCEFRAKVLPPGAVAGYTGTWVWGYLPDPTDDSTCADLIALYGDAGGVLDTYTGPVVLNQRGSSTDMTFINDLGTTADTHVLAWKSSTDQTLHWADPLNGEANQCAHDAMTHPGVLPVDSACAQNYAGPIPAAVHLHGGEVPPELDGGPDSWFTSDGLYKGHGYYTFPGAPANAATFRYPNTQEASPIWFHDHVLGTTRLNVYAGLAGAYLIADLDQTLPTGLWLYGLSRDGSVGADEITVPLVIQDRQFDTSGQLFFQADSNGGVPWATNPDHPYWSPEFVGDTIVVNGKAWPYLNVEPKRYRFLLLNGSNARTYELNIIDPLKVAVPPNMWVIATDGGYLDAPVLAKKLVMMPGERYEVIIDFAGVAPGTNLVIKNTAKTPFPGGTSPQGATTAQIVQLRVGACASTQCGVADTSFDPAVAGATIRAAGQKIVRLPGAPGGPVIVTAAGATQNVQQTRTLTLNEIIGTPAAGVVDPVLGLPYPGGPLEILVNNTKWSGASPRTYGDFTPITVGGITTAYSELPREGDTEVWEIVNLTADAHPIHLHLVQFQIIDRQAFDVPKYGASYGLAFPAVAADATCTGGVFCPGFGPPLPYDGSDARSGGKLGGNIDPYTPAKNGKPIYLKGMPAPPDPNEAGWKDTVVVYPGQVTRLAVRWAPTDLAAHTTGDLASLFYPFDPGDGLHHGYVWHCHIIDHEDNEMMRPDLVLLNPAAPAPGARPLKEGTDY